MKSPSTYRPVKGFTLFEVVIVTALFGMLMSLGLILSMDVLRGTTFRSTRDVLVSALATARGQALANLHESAHGVCYEEPDFIVFRGDDYATSPDKARVPGNPGVTLSSEDDFFDCDEDGIVFDQLTANTVGGDIVVSGEGHGDETVTVNAVGAILW